MIVYKSDFNASCKKEGALFMDRLLKLSESAAAIFVITNEDLKWSGATQHTRCPQDGPGHKCCPDCLKKGIFDLRQLLLSGKDHQREIIRLR